MCLIKISFIVFIISTNFLFSFKVFAQLDPQRQNDFLKAEANFGSSSKGGEIIDLTPIVTRVRDDFSFERIREESDADSYLGFSFDQEKNSLSIQGDTTNFNRQVFAIGVVANTEDERSLDTFTLLNRNQELLSLGVETEDTELTEFLIHSLDLVSNNDPNKTIIVNSQLQAISTPGFTNIDLNYELQKRETEAKAEDFDYKVLGEVSSTVIEDISNQQRANLLFTFQFNPCLVETGLMKAVSKVLESKREKQESIHVSAQCVIGENFEGKIFSSYYLIDKTSGSVDRIDLKTEVSLKIAEALYLRHSYINNPEETLIDSYLPTSEIDELSVEYLIPSQTQSPSSLSIDNVISKVGEFKGITIEKKTDDTQECVKIRSFSTGVFEENDTQRNTASTPLFLFRFENSCDPNRNKDEDELDPTDFGDPSTIKFDKEEIKETGFSFGNFHEVSEESARLFNYYSNISNSSESVSKSLTLGRVNPDDSEEPEYNVYEFRTSSLSTIETGGVNELSFGIVHKKDETFVSLEQILMIPLKSFRNRLRFQRPQISQQDRAHALNELADQGVTNESIDQKLVYAYEDFDLGLCNQVDCFTLGAGVTFSNTGGAFLTANGSTIAEVFGHEVELSLVFGTPLNINSSFFEDQTGFSQTTQTPFAALEAESYKCDKSKGFCADFSASRANGTTTFGLYLENEF